MTQEQTEQQVWQELASMIKQCPCTYLGLEQEYCAGCETVNATDGHDIGDCTCASCTHCHGTGQVPRFPWAWRECQACDGDGRDLGAICWRCHGTRRVIRPWSAEMAERVEDEIFERRSDYTLIDYGDNGDKSFRFGAHGVFEFGANPRLARLRALLALDAATNGGK